MGQMMKYSYFLKENELIYYDESGQDKDKLPVPVYTYMRPYMGHQFILHILLSLGKFYTELDIKTHRTLHNALCYAKIIGTYDEEESLKYYSRSLLWRFIEEKLVHLPNSFREIDIFIINVAQLFDDSIINYSTPITDMPPVL